MTSLSSPALALVVFTVAAAPAWADNAADEADIAFELGNRFYAHADFQSALREYFLSYRLVANRNVLFNIARCYEALERFNEAYRYYNDLLSTELPLSDRREVQAALARIRPRVALLRVETDPSGAEIFVEREDLGSRGKSPQTLALVAGRQTVLVKKEGYRPGRATVQLGRGRETVQPFPLELIVGRVALSGTPLGARVRQSPSGPVLASLPADFALPPGRHLLTIEAPGHAARELLVDVAADKVTSATVALESAPLPSGKVVLTSNRDNALVRVDGKEAGFTPTVLTLPEGEHVLEVSLSELRSFEQKITVRRDQEVALFAELRYVPPQVRAASKSLLSVDEAPASTTVITVEEIRAFGYTTLWEALAAIRGFFLLDDRQYNYVGIRGFLPPGDLNTRLLILWDGHSVNDVWAGQGYIGRDLNVDLEEVERIEIVRGPGSALYGTGAFFAVINVVPRETVAPGRTVEALGGAGGLGSWRGHIAASWRGEPGQSATISMAGYTATGAEETDLGTLGVVRGLDGEQAYNGSARARWGDLSFSALFNHRQKDIPTAPFDTLLSAPGTLVVDERGFAELRYEHAFPIGTFFARGYYDASRYHGDWIYGSDLSSTRTATDSGRADWIGTEARLGFKPLAQNQLTVGVEAQQQLRVDQAVFGYGNGPPLETRTRTLLSAYVSDEWALHPRFHISAGLRVDKYSDLDTVPVTPRLALILRPYPGGLTKLVAGSAFRAPDVYELYYDDNLQTQRPALHLNPESIITFELEHSHDLSRELRLTVAGYANRISQLIVLDPENSATPNCGDPLGTVQCIVFQNAPDLIRAYGAEAELQWRPGRYAMVDVSYSYVSLITRFTAINAMKPTHLAAGRLLLPLAETGIHLSTQAVYQSARYDTSTQTNVGEALVLNVGLSGEFQRVRFFAGINNLLDDRYALPTGAANAGPPTVPQYGRTFLVELAGSY